MLSIIGYYKSVHPDQETGEGAIQSLVIGGNGRTKKVADLLRNDGLDVRAILSPTVQPGTERLRIILHAYNTINEVDKLLLSLAKHL